MTILDKTLLFFLEMFGVLTEDKTPVMKQTTPAKEDSTIEEPKWNIMGALLNVPYKPSPNRSGKLDPEYLIIHYTANGGVSETVRHFSRTEAKVSAHIIIGRDGQVIQSVPFDRVAWHCGKSEWGGRTKLNNYSIGIELVNWGPVQLRSGKYYTWTGQEVPENETVWLARPADGKYMFWQTYTDAQVHTCFEVALAICEHYKLVGILGHEDISPMRKQDPGPAFDMEELRDYVRRKIETA